MKINEIHGESKKIINPKYIKLLFFTCWITYFLCYIGRVNYNAVMVQIIDENVLLKSQAGLISTCAFFSYGIGQLISGILVDRFSPKHIMTLGIAASFICNLTMITFTDPGYMFLIWGINGLAQSMTWTPIAKLFANKLRYSEGVKANVHFATCSIAGTIITYFICSASVAFLTWRAVFLIAAIGLVIAGILWWAGITITEKHVSAFGIMEHDEVKNKDDIPVASVSFWKIILMSGIIAVGFGAVVQGVLKDGVSTWIPTYMKENFDLGVYLAIMLATVIPLINLIGTYSASILNQKVFKNPMITSAFYFLIALSALISLFLFSVKSIWLSMILLSISTSAVSGVNVIIIGIVPLSFSKYNRAATISGAMNSLAYLGSAISVYGIGALSEAKGWNMVIILWAALSLLGSVIFIAISKRWNKFQYNA